MGRSLDSKTKSHDGYDDGSSVSQQDHSRIVYMAGDVNESSISQVITHMLGLASISTKPIQFVISTYGGSVDEMFSLYDVMKFLPCPVHTIGLGKIMSAGVLLLSSGKKGNRLLGKNSRVMMHPISGVSSGNIFEVINEVSEHKRMQDLMVELLRKETKMPKTEIDRIMKLGHDFYLTPEQAVKYGIVDRIIGDTSE